MHKLKTNTDQLKLRPIVSCIKSYNYGISKFLANLLSPHIPKYYCADDTFTFIKDIKEVNSSNKFMVSYDVVSLFTNIPLDETIDIAIDVIFKSNPNIKISKANLKTLFHFATSQSHFLFDNNIYDQVDGVAMGSSLGPVLANLFMSIHEKKWIEDYKASPISFYKRYVDDIFCLMDNEIVAKQFLDYLNSKHVNIKFTMETEVNKTIPFLDVLISSSHDGSFQTSVYRKSTFIGLFMNFESFTPICYKFGLVKTLIDRVYKICCNKQAFYLEFQKVKEYLCKNSYPPKLIDKQLKKYISKIELEQEEENNKNDNDNNIFYLKLPFIGTYSNFVKKNLIHISTRFCKNVNIKLVFTSKKVSSFFSTKDKIPSALRSCVVYKFTCACCNARYVGETTRHFDVRVHEHLNKRTKPSSIFKHLDENKKCRDACNKSCFEFIDSDASHFRLKVKEAVHTEWLKPNLNKQQQLLKMGILV